MTLEDSGIVSEYLRPEVLRLAVVMERNLRKNDWKGGWGREPAELLQRRAEEELKELAEVVAKIRYAGPSQDLNTQVWEEAGDVANFVMMLAEVASSEYPQAFKDLAEADRESTAPGSYRNIPRLDCQRDRSEWEYDIDRCLKHESGRHCGHWETHGECCDCGAEVPVEE